MRKLVLVLTVAASLELRGHFARNLRAHRTRAGLSQEALASACRLHRTEIGLLERSEREPRLSTIVRLAHGLGIPPTALLEGITADPPAETARAARRFRR